MMLTDKEFNLLADDSIENPATPDVTNSPQIESYEGLTKYIGGVIKDIQLNVVKIGKQVMLQSPIGMPLHKNRAYASYPPPNGYIFRPEILRNLHTKVDNINDVELEFILSTTNGKAFGSPTNPSKQETIDKAAKSMEDVDVRAIDVDIVAIVNGEKVIVGRLSQKEMSDVIEPQTQAIKRDLLSQYNKSKNKNNVVFTSKYKSKIALLGNSKRSFSDTWTDVTDVLDKEDKLNYTPSGKLKPIIIAVRNRKVTQASLNRAYKSIKQRLGKVREIRPPNVKNRTGGFYLVVSEPDGSFSTVPLKTKEVAAEDLKKVFEDNNVDKVIKAIYQFQQEEGITDINLLFQAIIGAYQTDPRLTEINNYFTNQQKFNTDLKNLFRFKIRHANESITIAPDVGKAGYWNIKEKDSAPIIFEMFARYSDTGNLNYVDMLEGFRVKKNEQAILNHRIENPNITDEALAEFKEKQNKKPLIQHIELEVDSETFADDINKLQSNLVAGVPFHSPVLHAEQVGVTTTVVDTKGTVNSDGVVTESKKAIETLLGINAESLTEQKKVATEAGVKGQVDNSLEQDAVEEDDLIAELDEFFSEKDVEDKEAGVEGEVENSLEQDIKEDVPKKRSRRGRKGRGDRNLKKTGDIESL